MKFALPVLLIAGFCSLISGCGEGSSAPTMAIGKFIDGPVGGLKYVSGSISGTTASDGSFTYEIGKSVKFSVNGVVIGEAPAEAVMTPIHLAAVHDPNANASSDEVVNIVRFLMAASTIDANGNMTIDNTRVMAPPLSQPVVFTDIPAVFGSKMHDVAPGMAGVSESQATSHLNSSIYRQCAGTYTGTYDIVITGRNGVDPPDSAMKGSWTLTIKLDGTVSGSTSQGDAINGSLNGTKFDAQVGYSMWAGKLDLATGKLGGTISFGRNAGMIPAPTFSGSR